MNKFFNKLMTILEEMGRARAAAYLASMGNHSAANALMKEIK